MTEEKEYKKWVNSYAKKYWYLITLLIFLGLIATGLVLISPIPIKILFDNILGNEPLPNFLKSFNDNILIIIVISIYIGLHFFQDVFGMFVSYVRLRATQFIDKKTMDETFNAANRIPYNDDQRKDVSDDLYKISSQSQVVSGYILDNSTIIIQAVVSLLSTMAILAFIDWRVTLVILAATPFLIFTIIHFGKRIEDKAGLTETANNKIYSFISESLVKLRTIQAFVYGKKRAEKLKDFVNIRNKFEIKQNTNNQLYSVFTNTIIILATSAALFMGAYSVINNAMTIGILVIYIDYINNAFEQISVLVDTIGSIHTQKAALKQAYEPIKRAMYFASSGITPPITGKIEFRNATFKREGKVILDSINLLIPAGSTVAILGASGSGKTTLINGILKFTPTFLGEILVDDHEVRELDTDYLRSKIAIIEQEPDLFDDTIDENIALAEPERQFDLIDIMSSALVADMSEFLKQRETSEEKDINNDKLSGGQKQRIAIARAYYKQAPILLMDEPTSALDRKASENIIKNILTYSKGKTTIIITHDPNLLKYISNIFVLSDHKIYPISQFGGIDAYYSKINQTANNS